MPCIDNSSVISQWYAIHLSIKGSCPPLQELLSNPHDSEKEDMRKTQVIWFWLLESEFGVGSEVIHNMNALRVIFAISSISACWTEAKQDNYYYGGYRQRPPSPPSWGWSASDVNRQDLDSTTRVAFFGTLATIAVGLGSLPFVLPSYELTRTGMGIHNIYFFFFITFFLFSCH